MQSLGWYVRRFETMSAGEVFWRTRAMAVNGLDRLRFPFLRRPKPPTVFLRIARNTKNPPFRVTNLPVGEWSNLTPDAPESAWYQALLDQADRIADHRLTFFDQSNRFLGNPIDWNRDHKSGRVAPRRFAPGIDYRDFRTTGDCKFVWEPSRHHQLVILGRTYRASGRTCYAETLVDQLDSWMDQCPFGIGMQWRSPLELAIRLINWVWALDLIHESGRLAGPFRDRLLQSVYLHLWEITRKFSRGTSVNNHLVGEAAGVFIATAYFADLKHADAWNAQSRQILAREILRQTFPDGGSTEQALGYHRFVLWFFLLAALVARWNGRDFSAEYWQRMEKMFEFIGALSEGGDFLPVFGDCDDGYVLDLGSDHTDVRQLLAVGALLYRRPDFKAWARDYSQAAHWLLGAGVSTFNKIPIWPEEERMTTRAFPQTGLYLLQYPGHNEAERISVAFDAGPLGLPPLAAHGHADALSFTLRLAGNDVLVDPGTYDYFSYRPWRDYFRSTRAHNTLQIDGRDQSPARGLFLWGTPARAKVLDWQPGPGGGRIVAEHDGYTHLKDPVIHRRTLDLNGQTRTLTVRDEVIAQTPHIVELFFHFSELCRVHSAAGNAFTVDCGPDQLTLKIDPQLTIQILTASEDPIAGWVSRGYHQKSPSTTLIARGRAQGNLVLLSQFIISGGTE